ncbi:MAG: DUF924 family protein [Qipengyuania sp.]
MSGAVPDWARRLLDSWFEDLDEGDWFGGDAVDRLLRERFESVLAEQGERPAEEFLSHRETARAAILLFDQIPRNLYRDTPRAYAWDGPARQLTHAFILRGWLGDYAESERQFVLMPLMHSEDIADQELSVEQFALHAPGALEFARSHRDVIDRFGRFPHRNAVLGRQSTPAELRAVEEGASW